MKVIGEILNLFARRRPKPGRIHIPLSPEERQWFKATLNHATFQRVLDNVYARRPSLAAPETGCVQPNALAANNRLHQLQGWELFEAALIIEAEEPKVKKPQVTETYPDAGTRIGDE
jgi:hypothetical protein